MPDCFKPQRSRSKCEGAKVFWSFFPKKDCLPFLCFNAPTPACGTPVVAAGMRPHSSSGGTVDFGAAMNCAGVVVVAIGSNAFGVDRPKNTERSPRDDCVAW